MKTIIYTMSIVAHSKEELVLEITLFLQDKGEIQNQDVNLAESSISKSMVSRVLNEFRNLGYIEKGRSGSMYKTNILTEKGEEKLF